MSENENALRVDLPGASVAFSTRRGGVSSGPYESLNLGFLTDDAAGNAVENRRLLCQSLGLDHEAVAIGHQVHGAELAHWDARPTPDLPLAEVDGHLTRIPGLALLVLTADCLPVALATPHQAAMLHCGWRGLAADIVAAAVQRFEQPPAAVVGPGIGGCCYAVGPEVLDAFADVGQVADGSKLDLRKVAEAKLRAAGVGHVKHVDRCTSCEPRLFFSHRRDAGVTGRQCGMVWLTG